MPAGTYQAYVELWTLDILEENSDRVLSRLVVVNVACSVRGQVCLAVLVLGDLVFAVAIEVSNIESSTRRRTPHTGPRRLARTEASLPAVARGAVPW